MRADAETETLVLGTLDALSETCGRRDLEGVLGLFASEVDVSLVGSEAGEIARGPSELRSFFERLFRRPGTFSFEWGAYEISARGDVAWFLAEATATYTEGESVTAVPYRTTAILQRGDSGWLIAHYHGSEPVKD